MEQEPHSLRDRRVGLDSQPRGEAQRRPLGRVRMDPCAVPLRAPPPRFTGQPRQGLPAVVACGAYISSIIEAKPQEVSTDSYLAFGPFNDKDCVANLRKYLRTKFLRFLLLQALTSMNISRGNFRFVPLQNFTPKSDINWYKSIEDIDYQLYAKYNLDNEEIAFIEKMIKPM